MLKKMSKHYVYLLREREHLRLDEPTYKLGKTTQEPNSRLAGYPKGSEVILFIDVQNCHSTESTLIREFDANFEHKKEYGREYYSGDLNKMKQTFFSVVNQEFEQPYVPNLSWRSTVWRWVKNLIW